MSTDLLAIEFWHCDMELLNEHNACFNDASCSSERAARGSEVAIIFVVKEGLGDAKIAMLAESSCLD